MRRDGSDPARILPRAARAAATLPPVLHRDADEELRHCLTVVSGYIGLVLQDRGQEPCDEHWMWLQRAQDAAVQGLEVFGAASGSGQPG